MPKNLYEILNVHRTASDTEIKKAYKSLCRKYHPDLKPDSPVAKFHDIQEAFRVLSHPQRRRHYDYYLDGEDQKKKPSPPPKPHTASLFHDFLHYAPSLEEIYDAFMSGYQSGVSGKSGSVRDLHVEITVGKEEARCGGTLSLEIPTPIPCPRCNGTGERFPFVCPACGGQGIIRQKRNILITYPPHTRDKSILEYGLDEFHIPGIRLLVHIRIL